MRCPSLTTLLPLLFNFASFGLCITHTLTFVTREYNTSHVQTSLQLQPYSYLRFITVIHALYDNLCHKSSSVCPSTATSITDLPT